MAAESHLETNQDHLFLSTLTFAGPCFLFFFIWFSCGRERFPFVFKPNVAEKLLTDVDSPSSCSFNILYHVYHIPNDYVHDQCGFDAYCFLKTLKTCFYIFLSCIPMAILVPCIYYSANGVQDMNQGFLPSFTVGNTNSKSGQLWATFAMIMYTTIVTCLTFSR